MRDAQIERLLGGYATNTLTESERQALFEAALDDQELFDALQDEHALKELLADSESRAMIERAAKESRVGPARAWFIRPAWAWGLAGCVAAAVALVFVLGPFGQATRQNQVAVLRAPDAAQGIPPPAAPAPLPAASVNATPAPKAVEQRTVAVAGKASKKEPAPEMVAQDIAKPVAPGPFAPPAGFASQAAPQMALGGGQQAQLVTVDKLKHAERTMHVLRIPYTLVRRGVDGSFTALLQTEALQAGDAVRVVARPPVSGSLSVYEQNGAREWNIIQSLPVSANGEYTVPRAPIEVKAETRLRLVMTSAETAAPGELQEAAKDALQRPKQRLEADRTAASSVAASLVPQRTLVTDITLVPGQRVSQ